MMWWSRKAGASVKKEHLASALFRLPHLATFRIVIVLNTHNVIRCCRGREICKLKTSLIMQETGTKLVHVNITFVDLHVPSDPDSSRLTPSYLENFWAGLSSLRFRGQVVTCKTRVQVDTPHQNVVARRVLSSQSLFDDFSSMVGKSLSYGHMGVHGWFVWTMSVFSVE